MNGWTFPLNPCKQGKSHHHCGKLANTLRNIKFLWPSLLWETGQYTVSRSHGQVYCGKLADTLLNIKFSWPSLLWETGRYTAKYQVLMAKSTVGNWPIHCPISSSHDQVYCAKLANTLLSVKCLWFCLLWETGHHICWVKCAYDFVYCGKLANTQALMANTLVVGNWLRNNNKAFWTAWHGHESK